MILEGSLLIHLDHIRGVRENIGEKKGGERGSRDFGNSVIGRECSSP